MYKFKRILSAALCFVIVVCSCVINVSAESKTGFINATDVRIRKEATTKSDEIIKVSNVTVVINYTKEDGQEVSTGNTVWYNITYTDNSGTQYTGFVYSEFVSINPEYIYDEDFEKNIVNFPESYRDALRALHAKYPNWQFVAHSIDIDFDTAVDLQYNPSSTSYTSNKKLVEKTYGGSEWYDIRAYDKTVDKYITKYYSSDQTIYDGRWTYASRAAIAYFVDPRNYFDEKSIYAFLQQAYNTELQNKNGLRTVVASTFLEKGYDKNTDGVVEQDAYIDDIMEAAEKSGVSPYVLAAAIIVEVGVNGGTVTSGTCESYDGIYKGYYNFYNWNATGDDEIKNALDFAKQNGWDSPNKAIVGGAQKYAESYVAQGQDTYYYKNYNYVIKPYSTHQFAESIYASITDSKRISVAFSSNTDGAAVFEIPVFKNMPSTASPLPSALDNSGSSGGSGSGGTTTTPTTPTVTIKKGDTNSDNSINAVDLAAVKMHILGVKSLSGDAATAGDVNGDGAINAVDLAAIKMHILGVKTIS